MLEIKDSAEEAIIRELVAARAGVTVIGPNEPHLEERADVDTVLLEDWPVVDLYMGQPPGVPVWVVGDAAWNIRVFLYEATVVPIDKTYIQRAVAAFWIASIPHYVDSSMLANADDIRDAERGRRYVPDEELYFPLFLNAFEVMERHDATGAMPPIHRVGVWGFASWMQGLLRAYQTYRERKLAGAYEPPNHGNS